MKPGVLVALHDAGGTAAIKPVLTALNGVFDFHVFAHDMAASELSGLRFELCRSIAPEQAAGEISKVKPALVLTGTSAPGDTIDRAFLSAAKKQGIPTLAVLDYWVNYRRRFADPVTDKLTHLPDRIAVMNADAKKEMLAEGIPEKNIVVTGSPRFEALAQRQNSGEEKSYILFLSQPFAAVYGDAEKSRAQLGYAEEDSIRMLVEVAKGKQVIARMHPREGQENRRMFESLGCDIAGDGEIAGLISASSLVCGMSSVAMVDAYLMKKPVISIQPNQKAHDQCYLTRHKLIPLCTSVAETASAVEKRGPVDFSRSDLFNYDAVENIRKIMAEMALKAAA